MGAEKGGPIAPPEPWLVYITVNGEDLVNTSDIMSEAPTTVLTITSTGCSVTINNTIVATWTYPGHCFLGFSTTQGATAPDATMEVGDTLTYTTSVSLALYSVGIPVPYLTTDQELASVANAIRTKGGTSAALEYPSEFISAIGAIQTGTPKAAQTYYPSTSDQIIASGYRLTGTQRFKGVLLTNLTAANIKKDVVVKVGDSADDDRIISVTGTYEGGGGIPNNLSAFVVYATTGTPGANTTRNVYFFESGMTWEQFVASDYSKNDFRILANQLQTANGSYAFTGCFDESVYPLSTTIQPGAYKYSSGSPK